MRCEPNQTAVEPMVRIRVLGCYTLSAALASDPADLDALLTEIGRTELARLADRLTHQEQDPSMERKKREGYF